MKYLAILIISVIGLTVAADGFGEYIPKAFFTIDENGNPSPARSINTETLNRIRRQVPIQPFNNNAGFGFPQNFFNQFPQPQPGQGTQGTYVSSSQTVNSRFGEDEPVVSGQSTVVHHHKGQYHQTNTYVRPDGSVTSNQHSGRVKRQQSQTQSQNTQGGNQLQSQSQNQPAGQQIQTQSQGNNVEPLASPASNPQYNQPQQNIQPDVINQQNAIPLDNQNYNPQYNVVQPDNRNDQIYPQQGQSFPQAGFSPFGIGAFGPGGAFGQQGFPQFGAQPGFPQIQFPFPTFPQPGFGGNFAGGNPGVPIGGAGISSSGINTESRFLGDDDSTSSSGTTQTFSNGNRHGVFHSSSSYRGSDGKVHSRHESGRLY